MFKQVIFITLAVMLKSIELQCLGAPLDENDFITDRQFDQLLKRLQLEALESIANPENFVGDDMDVDAIMKMFEEADNSFSNPETTTTEPANECSICLEPLESSLAPEISCNHQFHRDCLKGWFDRTVQTEKAFICPLCNIVRDIDTRRFQDLAT